MESQESRRTLFTKATYMRIFQRKIKLWAGGWALPWTTGAGAFSIYPREIIMNFHFIDRKKPFWVLVGGRRHLGDSDFTMTGP